MSLDAFGYPIGAANPPPTGARGCDECNRREPKPWPVFTVDIRGQEVCAKCLTPIHLARDPEQAA